MNEISKVENAEPVETVQRQKEELKIIVQPINGYSDKYLLSGMNEPRIVNKAEIQQSLMKLSQELQIQKRIFLKILEIEKGNVDIVQPEIKPTQSEQTPIEIDHVEDKSTDKSN